VARKPLGGIVFMVVWIVFWTAAILIALYSLGAEALAGEAAAVVFLGVWIAAALFALSRAARTLVGLLAGDAPGPPRRRDGRHHWVDDVPEDRASGASQPPPLPPEARGPGSRR